MRILIVGLGSIGKRHASILEKTGSIEIGVYRTFKGTQNVKSKYLEFYNFNDAINFKPDGVIVANPTSHHVATAKLFLEKGIKVLIEKPISSLHNDALVLSDFKKNIRIAYCLRFLPFISKLKKIIKGEKVFKLSFKRSYYLPKWHPYADYRKEYAAQKALGGGVIRTLSHEIDLMIALFGKPFSSNGIVDKLSDLEIDTDDFAFFSCKFDKGFRVNFELDFYSPTNINEGELITERGKYTWDMKFFLFQDYHTNTLSDLTEIDLFNSDLMYEKQIDDFINFLNSGDSFNATYDDALEVMKVIESIDNE
jgi:predicted dehydrogenase